jgi:hypothetical protein
VASLTDIRRDIVFALNFDVSTMQRDRERGEKVKAIPVRERERESSLLKLIVHFRFLRKITYGLYTFP